MLLSALFSVPVHADISSGLTAYYSFDDISGATAPDSSGNHYDGTITGGASTVSGAVGDALSFDGSDDTVDVPHQLVSGQAADFSYSFYARTEPDGDDSQYILAQASSGTNNNDCFSVGYDNTANTLKVLTTNNGNNAMITKTVDLGEWTHIAVTNSNTDNESILYINGVPATGLAASCGQALGAQFLMGRSPWAGYNQQLNASLDEVRIYDRVLTQADIYQLATEGDTNSITISTPLNESVVGGAVTLETAVSGLPDIDSVQYYANGQAIGDPETNAPYAYDWDTTELDQGDFQLVAVASDTEGNKLPSPIVNVEVDNVPTVAMKNTHSIGQTSATIVWTTDEPTTGQIEYGPTDDYGSETSAETELNYFHSHTITNLEPNTTYHYQINSTDNNDNSLSPVDYTFSTLTDIQGNEWHVTTTGSSDGDGSLENPWDLASTLYTQPESVQPGDTIWLHGGTYSGYFYSRLTGSETAPIIVRNYDNQRVIIDGGTGSDPGHFVGQSAFYVGGSDAWYWGLEVMSSSEQRTTAETGSIPTDLNRAYSFYIEGPRTRFINNIVHDAAQGFGFWTPAVNAELYGNLVYYNGWEAPDRGHGHGIYAQNDTGLKYIANNFVFKNFGWGLHAYTQGGRINNIMTEENTFFESGALSVAGRTLDMLHGGYQIAQNPILFNNATYMTQTDNDGLGGALGLGYVAGCDRATVANNYFAAKSAIDLSSDCPHTEIKNNLFYGTAPGSMSTDYPDNTYTSSAPDSNNIISRQNTYEPNKIYMTIYNWENTDSVAADLSDLLVAGDTYEIYDVQNYFGDPITSGTYSGTTLDVPMTSTAVSEAVGNGTVDSTHTEKEFGSFILVKTGHVDPPVDDDDPPIDEDPPTDNPPPVADEDDASEDSNSSNSSALYGVSKVSQKSVDSIIFSSAYSSNKNPENKEDITDQDQSSVGGNYENQDGSTTGHAKNKGGTIFQKFLGLSFVAIMVGSIFWRIFIYKSS